MATDGNRSPWLYVGLGCLGAVVLGVLAVGGLGFVGWRWARGMEQQIKDPALRQARVLEVLGAERLPEGYHAVVAMEVPFVMEMAVLSDRPPEDLEEATGAEGIGERGLIYFSMPNWGDQRQELEDFLEGRTDDADFLRQSSIDLERGEVVARGELRLAGEARARWVAQHGSIGDRPAAAPGADGATGDYLTATVLIECPGDERVRMALWFGPDPGPPAAVEALPAVETRPVVEVPAQAGDGGLAGSVADPEALAAFFGQFRLCG